MNVNKEEKIRVAICGGGITGATLANLLLNHPSKFEVTLFEAAKQFEEIGTAIGMWARALNVFREIGEGVYEACMKVAGTSDPNERDFVINRRVADGGTDNVDIGPWRVEGGSAFFHRATLLNILVANISQDRVHFNKRLAAYESVESSTGAGSEIILHFTDGTTAVTDLLIGCDGIKSAIRKQMYTAFSKESGKEACLDKYVEPVWSGSLAYRALVPAEPLRRMNPDHPVFKTPLQYFALDRHLVTMSINEKLINLVAFKSDFSKEGTVYPEEKWVKEVSQADLLASYEDFSEETKQLFKLVSKSMLWAIHALKEPLPTFVSGNVALVGDAAHAMTPHLGIGAGMGIEDASVLTKFLTSPFITRTNVSVALKTYDRARVGRTGDVLRMSQDQGKAYEFRLDGVGRDLEETKKWIDRNTKTILAWKVEEDVEGGLK